MAWNKDSYAIIPLEGCQTPENNAIILEIIDNNYRKYEKAF